MRENRNFVFAGSLEEDPAKCVRLFLNDDPQRRVPFRRPCGDERDKKS